MRSTNRFEHQRQRQIYVAIMRSDVIICFFITLTSLCTALGVESEVVTVSCTILTIQEPEDAFGYISDVSCVGEDNVTPFLSARHALALNHNVSFTFNGQ